MASSALLMASNVVETKVPAPGGSSRPLRPAGHPYYNEPRASGRYYNEPRASGRYYNEPRATGRYYNEPIGHRDRMDQEEILSDAGGWPQDIEDFPQGGHPSWLDKEWGEEFSWPNDQGYTTAQFGYLDDQGFLEGENIYDQGDYFGSTKSTVKRLTTKIPSMNQNNQIWGSTKKPLMNKEVKDPLLTKRPRRKKPIQKRPNRKKKTHYSLQSDNFLIKIPSRKDRKSNQSPLPIIDNILEFISRPSNNIINFITKRSKELNLNRKKDVKTLPNPKRPVTKKKRPKPKPVPVLKKKRPKAYIGQPDRFSDASWPAMTEVMQGMLDFLSSPSHYLDNFQSSYAGGPVKKPGNYGNVAGGSYGGGSYGGGGGGGGGGGDFLSGLLGDTSLSRQDFVLELATWFRRAIWFIIVTAAILASPGLFITAAILGVIFETVYNVTNARRYWQEVYGQQGYDRGNLDYASGSSSKVGEDEYEYEDYVQYYPVATKQGGLYRGQLVSYGGVSRPSLAWDRTGLEEEEEEDGYVKDWRYVLGLPPWFLRAED